MLYGPHRDSLKASLARLAGAAVIPDAAAQLRVSAEAAGRILKQAVLAEVPAFAASQNPDILPALETHGGEHIAELLRLFAGGDLGGLQFVVGHAERRAEQRFPLDATLHAYRCGHRVLSRWLRDAALALGPATPDQVISDVADFAIEYTNAISTVAAAAYADHARRLAEAESDQRSELLRLLLAGYDESDSRIARILKQAGYLDQRQAYCVAVFQPMHAGELAHPERGLRITAAIAAAFAGTSVRVLSGVRASMVVAILSDRRRQSGWTAPSTGLMERARPVLETLGTSVKCGISSDHPATAHIPKALQEAVTALDFASITARCVAFGHLPLRRLLVHGAGQLQKAAPPWVEAFLAANAQSGGTLLDTLRALADADLNMQDAGRRLGRHANTLYARASRIRDITGKDPQRFHDLTELLLAADCWQA